MGYDYWEKALADPKALRAREFRITTEPQDGYYRTYKLLEPVAIWHDAETGQLVIQVNGYEPDEDDYETIWLHSAKNPVSEEAFQKALDGGGWDDLDDAVAAIGDNRRKGDDAAAIIDDLAGQAAKYFEITDDAMAKRAISLRAALQEQGKKVDKAREILKAPILKAAREIDDIWMPTVKLAKTWADYLRHLVEQFETAKRRAAREAELLSQPVLAEPVDQIRTGYGRAASVRTKLVVSGIRDIDEVLRWYRGDPRLSHSLRMMAQEDVDAGAKVAGVIYEEAVVIR
jgi:hypothetical protein